MAKKVAVNTKTGEVVDEAQIRPFADWLREQAKGKSHDELSEALHDLVARVQETGRKGALVYTVVVEPMKDGAALVVKDHIKAKLPEYDRDASLFWADDNGNLTRSDPNQLAFETLRDVSAADEGKANPKEAAQ